MELIRKRSNWALGLVGAAAVVAGGIGLTQGADGADHADAPGVQGDRAADINDLYAFRSPENPDNLVVALTVNPLTAPMENTGSNFAENVDYNIHVDLDGDLAADATVTTRFSGGQFTVSGLGDAPITGAVTAPTNMMLAPTPQVTEAGGIKVFTGQRDDPFFFDLVGFNNYVAGPFTPANGLRPAGETPSDTLAGLNVSAIVIELPVAALTGDANSGTIKAWASTTRGGTQVDRMAIPAINTALIPSNMKDAFNAGSPATDEAQFRATGQATIEGLRGAVAPFLGDETGGPLGDLTAEQVAGALIPDIVTIDFSQAVGFPNGRTLNDDVVDVALGVVLNRGGAAGVGDAVDANDRAFSSSFPYLASPWQPAAAPPDTGSGLAPVDSEGSNWLFPVTIVGGVMLLAASGGMALKRRTAGEES